MEKETFFIEGLILVKPRVFTDERGYFFESFSAERYRELGIPAGAVVPLLERCDRCFMQDNVSSSKRGVLRGLHFQSAPFAQGKLVSVLHGKVLDVAVDIRRASPTFGNWVSALLSAENRVQIFVPKGFAHGYLTLEPDTEVFYKVSDFYSKDNEAGLVWDDPALGIDWCEEASSVVIADRDRQFPKLADLPAYF